MTIIIAMKSENTQGTYFQGPISVVKSLPIDSEVLPRFHTYILVLTALPRSRSKNLTNGRNCFDYITFYLLHGITQSIGQQTR